MASQKHTYRIASIPGDGIGIEVVDAAIQVVEKLAKTLGTFDIDFTHIPWGTAYYKEHGRYVSEDCLDTLRKFDAGLFGAVGAPDVPDHISLWGLLLALRGPLQLYANVRPVRTFPGTKCPLNTATEGIDWMLVRENSEGEYSGQGGRSHVGQPWEAATEVAMFTRVGIERIMRFAFEVAQSRPRKLLTVVTKSNSMRNGMVLWDQVAAEVAKDFPDVTWDKMLVDAMTVRMVAKPQSIDTIVGTNLHMDILSDLAAALAGSIGVAPSSNLDPTRKNPSIFEPVHGSAFDITGKGVANPVATFWSAAEMLSWLGEKEAAKKLMDCVERVCAAGILTPDLGGTSNTQGVVDAVNKEIERLDIVVALVLTIQHLAKHHVLARMESTDLTSGPSEIGSLTAQSNEESQFVGSSSGVYFINTVRQAFSRNLDTLDASSGQEFPLPEDTLVGIDGSHHDRRSAPSSVKASPMPGGEQPFCQWEYDPAMAAILGQAPPLDTARELMMDSDIDVCAPGADEIHVPGSHRAHGLRMGLSTFNLDDRASSAPASSADAIQLPAEQSFGHESHRNTPSDSEPLQNKREIAFASYVESGKLTGRALELFHKSILVRSIRRSSVLFLITDVHKWWNSLSVDLQTLRPPTDQDAIADRPFNFGPFFTVLYQHLILLINRPSLSLSPSTPEFCSGLQTCIGAAREILTALKAQVDAKQALFWPGFLSAAWMSGLVLAFACQLRQYVLSKGLQEISKCLDFLQLMSPQWETAKNCHRALTLLSRNIQHSSTVPSLHRPSDPLLSRTRPEDDNDPETRKKRRLHSHPVTRNSRLGSASFETTHNGTEHPSDKDDNTNDPGLGVSRINGLIYFATLSPAASTTSTGRKNGDIHGYSETEAHPVRKS
ncbi:hypothetical protein APSETT445_002679 [Aspergillus pseudonomiae]